MAHFDQAFWTADYAAGLHIPAQSSRMNVNHSAGLGILFGKLQQGVRENEQILTIARMRADAEDLYGQHMGDIIPATDRLQDGFQKDDGASVKKVSTD